MPVLAYRANIALAKQIREAAKRDDRCVSAFTRRAVIEALKRQTTEQSETAHVTEPGQAVSA